MYQTLMWIYSDLGCNACDAPGMVHPVTGYCDACHGAFDADMARMSSEEQDAAPICPSCDGPMVLFQAGRWVCCDCDPAPCETCGGLDARHHFEEV